MTISRRQFVALSGQATIGAALLSACGGSSGSGSGGSKTFDFWNAFSNSEAQNYFQKNMVAAYKGASKPKLSVKQVDTIDRLTQTALAAGRGPDLVVTDGPAQALAYADAKYIAPLDSYIAKYGWDTKLEPWALSAGRVQGKLYSLPSSYETMAMFFNPATLSQHGWKPPTDRAEFEAICADAHGKGMTAIAAGNADWKAATEWHVTIFLNHFAGPDAVHQALQGKLPWTDPVFVDAISLLNSYFQKGWFGGGVDKYFTNKFDDLYSRLAAGKAALYLSGTWSFTEIGPFFGKAAGNSATWDWAPLFPLSPHAPQEVWELSVGGTYSINSKSQDPDAVAQYIDFLVSDPKRQAKALADVGFEPVPIKLSPADFPAGADARYQRLYTTLGNAKTIGYTTWTFWPQRSDTYIFTSFDKVIVGKITPQEYCAGLDAVFKKELASGKVPPFPAPTAA
jgi:raffinose/stachyose/melibiose transport system substrate-binding protein